MTTHAQLETLLAEKIRPSLQAHGGNVEIISYTDGILRIRLTGRCSGCPSATLTTEEFINQIVQTAFPDVREVRLAAGVSEALLAEAKVFLRRSP